MIPLIVALTLIVVALAVHRFTCPRTVPQDAVRGLYWLSALMRAYAVAVDRAIVEYRTERVEPRDVPLNERCES